MSRLYDGNIRLLVLDVDGVLTDNSLFIGGSGEEFKVFNARDGIAIALLRTHGVRTAIISGKASTALEYRISELGIDLALLGRVDKVAALEELVKICGVTADKVAFVGDDVIDLPLAPHVSSFYAPADAHPLVLAAASFVLKSSGGRGAVRETAEHMLACNGFDLMEMYAPLAEQWEASRATQ